MRLAAIINAWGDTAELIRQCGDSASEWADSVYVILSDRSNIGESFDWSRWPEVREIMYYKMWVPNPSISAQQNEVNKRNFALEQVKKTDATHFIMMDADEFYKADQMNLIKEGIDDLDLNGVVHPVKVYVGKPTLWCEDHTLVPGIQKLNQNTILGKFERYPFAYDAEGHAHIDPTRRVNYLQGINMTEFHMHHMSYVRRDIDLKIRNSSANLRRSEAAIKRDIANAAPGYMSELYHRELKECENLFNITI